MTRPQPQQTVTPRELLDIYLKEQKMRRTPERYAILERALSMPRHFSVDELCERLESETYHVSRATVYNALQLFVSARLLQCHRFGQRESKYEVAAEAIQSNHIHLICLKCGKIKEMKESTPMMNEIRFRGFTPHYHTVYVYGLCATCRRKGNKSKKEAAK